MSTQLHVQAYAYPAVLDAGASAPARLVGRRRELEAIDAALDDAVGGRSAWIALAGEPGIGKTRLIAEACDRAARAGIAVVEGRGTEFEREIPYGVVVDALDRRLARRGRDWLSRLGEPRLAELAALLPSLAVGGEARLETTLAAERYRSYDAVRAVLDQLAAERPLLVALDDLHWADDASLELIAHLMQGPSPHPVVALVAYRPRCASPRLLDAVARAQRDADLTTLELTPLSRAETRELLVSSGDEDSLHELYRETGGNPFYLTELTRSMRSSARRPAGEPAGDEVPAAVQAAIARELDEMSPAAATLLRAAAVGGEPFALELAAEIADVSPREASALLDELLTRGLVRPAEARRRYVFRHPIVRGAVYASSGRGFRLAAHARAADSLRRSGASVGAIAHHVERSARPGDAQAARLLAAAAKAAEARAPAAAARWYEGALRLLPDDAPRDERLGLLTARALALGATGEVHESTATLTSALSLLASDEVLPRARLVGALSRLEHMIGEHGRARRLLLDSLADLGDSDALASAALRTELALDCWSANDIAGMASFARAARDAARERDPVLHGFGEALMALASCHTGRGDEAAASADLAAALVDGLPDSELVGRVDAFSVLGYAELNLDRLAQSARHLERGIAICRTSDESSWFVRLLTLLAFVRGWQGRLAEAEEAAAAATAAARLAHPLPHVHALKISSWIQLLRGDLRAAIATGREVTAISEQLHGEPQRAHAHITLALAEIESGEAARGRDRLLAEMGGDELTSFAPNWRQRWFEVLSGAELALGDLDAAERWADRAAETLPASAPPGRRGEVNRARAAVELAQGRARSCAELARDAAEGFSAVGRRIDAGRAWTLQGRAHIELGERELAVEVLRRAHSELEACGARRYRAAAARELRRLGRPVAQSVGRPAHEDGPLGALSRREREVADLVARGLRNREIAAELVLSPKTVETHLTHIYEKLGVSGRVQVVRLAQRDNPARLAWEEGERGANGPAHSTSRA